MVFGMIERFQLLNYKFCLLIISLLLVLQVALSNMNAAHAANEIKKAENPGELVLRKVLVMYDSAQKEQEDSNHFFEVGQVILNYFGILVDYWDVQQRPLPTPKAMAQYRGVITWFISNKLAGAREFLTWLNKQFDYGRKVVILGEMGGTLLYGRDTVVTSLVLKIYRRLGVEYKESFTTNKRVLRYSLKAKNRVEFERNYPFFPPVYEYFRPINKKKINLYLTIKRKDLPGSDSAIVFTSPNGGFAYFNYIFWQDPITFRKKWHINPFLFFQEALGLTGLPSPDPTTLNGSRLAFAHIDGDAFGGFTRINRAKYCAQIIKEDILEKYSFPHSASVIVAEIEPKLNGKLKYKELAREIYRMPNIEPASHSFSHPFYWNKDDKRSAKRYPHQHGIKVKGYTFDAHKEIITSMQYVTSNLTSPDKPCQLPAHRGANSPG